MNARPPRALVLGWRGGVATALLGLLERHTLGRAFMDEIEALVLLDRCADARPPDLPRTRVIADYDVASADDLARVIREHGITSVIELGEVGTYACLDACERNGASFLTTGFDNWPTPDRDPNGEEHLTMIASLQLLPDRRPKATRAAHLLGSGMNPGVVNVLIRPAIEALSRRAAQPTEVIEADLVSILFTEIDSTEEVGGTDREVMATTWNPRHFVEELLEPHAMYSANGRPSRLAHRPDQRRYRARCGADIIEGFVVPHDEVTTMGAKYPGCEVAYVYRPNPAADAALSAHPTRGIADWALRRLYPPHAGEMCGGNRIGVLLTTRSFGELWFGYDTPIDVALPFGTNATLLQVAAGVLAGWRALSSLPAGVFTTEDLDPGPYLRVVDAFLGSPGVYDDPQADSMPLIRRAVLPVDETTTSRSR